MEIHRRQKNVARQKSQAIIVEENEVEQIEKTQSQDWPQSQKKNSTARRILSSLQKGHGYHLDLLVVAFLVFSTSLLGKCTSKLSLVSTWFKQKTNAVFMPQTNL